MQMKWRGGWRHVHGKHESHGLGWIGSVLTYLLFNTTSVGFFTISSNKNWFKLNYKYKLVWIWFKLNIINLKFEFKFIWPDIKKQYNPYKNIFIIFIMVCGIFDGFLAWQLKPPIAICKLLELVGSSRLKSEIEHFCLEYLII